MTATEGAPAATESAGDAWLRHMRRGAWGHAWAVGDAVRRARAGATCWHVPRHEQWVWDGSPLDGRRVLVRCYHGLGDTLQFARFVPPLRATASDVTMWAQPALLPLLTTMRGVGALAPLHDGTPEVAYDVDVEAMELAHVLRATPGTLPPPPHFELAPAPLPADGRLRVGIAWECGDWDRSTRSIPFPLLAPLARVPGVALHVLQRGAALADALARPDFGVVSGSDDVLAAARVVRALDLVVTIDSFPAHLAGSLGVPVWTLLPHAADWRWMDGRDDTPWYPTMRLFRQTRPGDWEGVVGRVAGELARLSAERDGERDARPVVSS
ncbi:hypothetical protein tb265_26680 [Gemmatimonadetes bacterium T265]|nr:hypothetical protein tb265_26680 [Gemmatimonadetes bacterium T265]